MRKEHPILFSTPMVKAILEGRKTQTRRVVKPQPEKCPGSDGFIKITEWIQEGNEIISKGLTQIHTEGHGRGFVFPKNKYEVGGMLWVRETFLDAEDYPCHPFHDEDSGVLSRYDYIADCPADQIKNVKWKPNIFMPKEAARIWLEITNIKVERLQDISEDDAQSEGIFFKDYGKTCFHNGMNGDITNCPADEKNHPQKRGWSHKETNSPDECLATAKTAFGNLWQSINGAESWDANPWVWVIEFKRIDK